MLRCTRLTDCVKLIQNTCVYMCVCGWVGASTLPGNALISITCKSLARSVVSTIWKVDRLSNKLPRSRIRLMISSVMRKPSLFTRWPFIHCVTPLVLLVSRSFLWPIVVKNVYIYSRGVWVKVNLIQNCQCYFTYDKYMIIIFRGNVWISRYILIYQQCVFGNFLEIFWKFSRKKMNEWQRYVRGVSRRTIERLFDFKKTVMVFQPGCEVVRNRRYVDEIGSNWI